jgi:hypothetical protein
MDTLIDITDKKQTTSEAKLRYFINFSNNWYLPFGIIVKIQ